MSEATRIQLSENLQSVRDRISDACRRVGRVPDDVTLVAVTKYAELNWVGDLVDLGVKDLGEARPQQMVQRAGGFPKDIRWHLIGHLQRNKADEVVSVAHLIHSCDSLRLFDHLAKLGKSLEKSPRVLLEVNISGESSKDGFSYDELLSGWPKMQSSESLEIAGLMTMAPLSDDSKTARPMFRRLRELRDQLVSASDGRWPLNDLSMGMSSDFDIAIEEGATIVRIGSSLFERLPATH